MTDRLYAPPLDAVHAAAALRDASAREANPELVDAIRRARLWRPRATWQEIGDVLGVSRQACQQLVSRRDR